MNVAEWDRGALMAYRQRMLNAQAWAQQAAASGLHEQIAAMNEQWPHMSAPTVLALTEAGVDPTDPVAKTAAEAEYQAMSMHLGVGQ